MQATGAIEGRLPAAEAGGQPVQQVRLEGAVGDEWEALADLDSGNRFLAADATARGGEGVALEPLQIDVHLRVEIDGHHVPRCSLPVTVRGDLGDVDDGRDDHVGEKKPGDQINVVAGRAHGDGECLTVTLPARTALEMDGDGFLYRESIGQRRQVAAVDFLDGPADNGGGWLHGVPDRHVRSPGEEMDESCNQREPSCRVVCIRAG
jgi:hypothetical protein